MPKILDQSLDNFTIFFQDSVNSVKLELSEEMLSMLCK